MLSVLAYNIHFGKKLKLIEKWLLKRPTKFDIICLQEFPFSKDSSFLQTFQKQGYGFKFAPSSFLTKPFLGNSDLYGELTLYNSKKVKLINHKVAKLGANFLEKRFRVQGEKTSLMTLFKYKNKKIVMANSQLVCYTLNSRRINQISKIIKNVKAMGNHHSGSSTVILGDFNYTSRIRQKKLIEFMTKNDLLNAYTTNTHKFFFVTQQLDYVFYNGCVVKNATVGKVKYSDHFPVWFDIDFTK